MFKHSRFAVHDKLEEEFSRPVESIMRCEDFKSNFARRLSNRHITKSPVSPSKQDNLLKLRLPNGNTETLPDNVPERIELVSQLSKSIYMEQTGDTVKPPDKTSLKNSDIRSTEVSALNMEVETLRWQLSQTEANRQMHIALLRQIVTFLNRVKEHIEFQNNEISIKKEKPTKNLSSGSFNIADLPRSKSVFHVNKHLEYTLNGSKKMSNRKISKSIQNVTGYKDCIDIWSQSKLSLTPDTDNGHKISEKMSRSQSKLSLTPDTDNTHKISEEMSRLITLANTVLSTNLPDLTCNESNNGNNMQLKDNNNKIKNTESSELTSLNELEDNKSDINDNKCTFKNINSKFFEVKEETVNRFIIPHRTNGLVNEISSMVLNEKDEQNCFNFKADSETSIIKTRKTSIDKKNDYNFSNFIEDESGFSSMNSFQEIGIPIISVIPPSPCKEVEYVEGIQNILEESEKWKTDTMEQTVKVFWV